MTGRSFKSIRLRSALIATSGLLLTAAAPRPDVGLEGKWRNTRNTVHLRLAPCGNAICGTVVWANQEAETHARKGTGKGIVGVQLLSGLRQRGDGKWHGQAFVPAVNSRAAATVTRVSDDKVRVSGCVLGGIVCKTQHWHRID